MSLGIGGMGAIMSGEVVFYFSLVKFFQYKTSKSLHRLTPDQEERVAGVESRVEALNDVFIRLNERVSKATDWTQDAHRQYRRKWDELTIDIKTAQDSIEELWEEIRDN